MNKYIKLKKKHPAGHWISNETLRMFSKSPYASEELWVVNGKINIKNEIRAQHLVERIYHKRRHDFEEALKDIFLDKLPIIKGARKNENGEWACLKCGSTDFDEICMSDGVGFWSHHAKCTKCGARTVYIGGYGSGGRRKGKQIV